MQGDDLCDLVGIGHAVEIELSTVVGVAHAAAHRHGGHPVLTGHPGLHAEHIIEAHGAQQDHHSHRGHAAAPGLQHPEGLFQQHLGGKVARGGPQHHAHRQQHGVSVPAEEGGGDDAEGQAHAEGDAVLEHGAHQGDGHHVPCRLHMAAAVEEQGDDRHDQARGGVDAQHPGFFQIGHAILTLNIPGGLHQGVHGGEVLHQGRSGTAGDVAEEELAHELGDQHIETHGQAVEDAVEGGQGQDVAGKHGAQGGKGEEEQGQSALSRRPLPQGGETHPQGGGGDDDQLHGGGEQGHGQVGQHGKGQARQILGDKQGLPAHGQGVHHAGGAVVIQVAEHRHGAQHPKAAGDEHAGLDPAAGHLGGLPQPLFPIRFDEVHNGIHREIGIQQIDGDDQGPHEGVQDPQGPEAPHGLAVKGGIKARCPGPHSPHLPIHR